MIHMKPTTEPGSRRWWKSHQSIASEHGGFIIGQCACDEVAYMPFRMAATSPHSQQMKTRIRNKSQKHIGNSRVLCPKLMQIVSAERFI